MGEDGSAINELERPMLLQAASSRRVRQTLLYSLRAASALRDSEVLESLFSASAASWLEPRPWRERKTSRRGNSEGSKAVVQTAGFMSVGQGLEAAVRAARGVEGQASGGRRTRGGTSTPWKPRAGRRR